MSQGPFSRPPDCNKVCEDNAEGTNCSSARMVFKPGKSTGKKAKFAKVETTSNSSNSSENRLKIRKSKKRNWTENEQKTSAIEEVEVNPLA